ncbi:hypothetical protein N7495_002538 [Penicillium taxi]|uniref:uncharacterized protein n=1 Tax=Penicillium taxi TaxID=168475 RepID=UPI00254509F0|nr:uncharacterized protein N7495_002538 [Penicillium taxi]KAJ5902010.1 hypothetical protein N7495_002538 [Penicillium taxi]
MSRSQFPPTPAMSGELIIKDQPYDGTDVFALPPAALSPAQVESESRRSSRSDPTYIPVSPTSPKAAPKGRNTHQSRSSTGTKRSLEGFELPPPPTRARKIIQMKPKSPATSKALTKPKENGKTSSQSPDTATTSSKKKQPSTTSAAGRKIARKTAHSLIERRRRSKMNEEFGTLKDMIPACRGQEMHKLAILQASIDYVNYLEQCIQDLKSAGTDDSVGPPSPTSPEFIAQRGVDFNVPPHQRESSSEYSYSASESPEALKLSAHTFDASPSFSPRTRMPSVPIVPDISSVLPSPALGPTHPMGNFKELQGIDHEASAALLMLTQDRRGTAESISKHLAHSTVRDSLDENKTASDPRPRGMSVRDLLIS